MTRKHFAAIAAAFAAERRWILHEYDDAGDFTDDEDVARYNFKIGTIHSVERRVADELSKFNPSFDRDRFLAACRGE